MGFGKRTYVYKVAAGCEIRADVYARDDRRSCPVIVWIHGGALIMGHRSGVSAWQRDSYLNAGYTVVAIDYRLAPETKLASIIEDVQDAFRWVRDSGPDLFRADPTRVAAIGPSAGGYLALMAGFCVDPRPRAVVSFYGYGDLVGAWYSRPDPFYRQQPLVTREEAHQVVGQSCISEPDGRQERHRFYLYCRQQGLWPKEVVGHDPDDERQEFGRFCPIHNVAAGYPPTLLLHGDRDTDVPYEQSRIMAEALARAGIEHELITIPGGGHGFDAGDHPLVGDAFRRVLAFLAAHLG